MSKKLRTKDYMYNLLEDLNKLDILLTYYEAHSTNSCYVKMDNGVCGSIRIADHKGIEKYSYLFNLMLNIPKSYEREGRKYYCTDDYDKMIQDIKDYRESQMSKFGFRYFDFMVKNKNEGKEKKGFWQYAKEYNS